MGRDHIKKLNYGFVSDDVFAPLDEHEMADHLGYSSHNVNRIHLYVPPLPKYSERPLVFFVVHGTWSSQSPGVFFDAK